MQDYALKMGIPDDRHDIYGLYQNIVLKDFVEQYVGVKNKVIISEFKQMF